MPNTGNSRERYTSVLTDKLQFQQEGTRLSLDLMEKAAIQHTHGFAHAEVPMDASSLLSIIYFGTELIRAVNDVSSQRNLTNFNLTLSLTQEAGAFVDKLIVLPQSPISSAPRDFLRSDVAAQQFLKTPITDLFLERVVFDTGYIRRKIVGLGYVNDDSPSQTKLKF